MAKYKFYLKHFLATILCIFKGKENLKAYRSLMFHSVYSDTKGAPRDLYSISVKNLKRYIDELKKMGAHFVRFESSGEDNSRGFSITFDDGFKDNLELVLPLMIAEFVPFTIFIATDFLDQAHKFYLDESDVRELAAHPLVTLGTHGKSHRPLTSMTVGEARVELEKSKRKLEQILGREVTTMSFPHGLYNAELVKAAQEIGYKKIGTSDPHPNPDNQGAVIFRQCIYSCETSLSFRQKVRGLWDWVW